MDEQFKLLLDNNTKKQEAQIKRLEDNVMKMMQAITDMKEQIKNSESGSGHASDSLVITNQGTRSLGFVPKLEFPKFDGSNPRVWIKKASKYFELCKIPYEQRVDLASLHMLDKAENWISSYLAVRKNVEWGVFTSDLTARFRDETGINIVEQFNKLTQQDSLEKYIDDFEDLRAVMLQINHILPDNYILDSFIGGLKPSVKPFVRAFKPNSISQAIEYARLQEESLAVMLQRSSKFTFNSPKPVQSVPLLANSKPPLLPTPQTKPDQLSVTKFNPRQNRNTKFVPADIRAEKIAKGLCYFCDQAYERGHKCKFRENQLFTVEVPGEVEQVMEEDMVEQELVEENEPCISVNALAGGQNFQTMRVKGLVGDKIISILIDSGSTHNFVDITLAQSLKCKLDTIAPQAVTVADGNHIPCTQVCKSFQWNMSGQKFVTEAMLIPLGGCDMVLGVQWLSTLGPVKWDFKKLTMEFIFKGNSINLQGVPCQKVKIIDKPPSLKMLQTAAHLCFIEVKELSSLKSVQVDKSATNKQSKEESQWPELTQLREQFAAVFEEPTELPPHRGIYDHKIPLEPNSSPVNIRPYRYPLKQRDVIEQLIQEMLDRGIIQDSSSPFASPVVLVGKKDGTWRLCIDYRELNRKTVKDKFPIPVIDELIDELAGAQYFTKLDLRAGYHQLRLHPDEVFKTAFKTHTGHYEFLVMPFGLTNAPASFQAWMNAVFKPLLRKCVLVFFDDILVYSKNLNEHWSHLAEVFTLMRTNQMYAKLSKCTFAQTKVEYLGHFISATGIETDPNKLSAVDSWPVPSNVKDLRSFLGLTGYYRKFVRGYALLSRPLTDLLKKGSFHWTETAQDAFNKLKVALTTAPVLAIPDFNKQFIVETDASKTGIGAVLMQESHPLAFISRALGPKWQKLSVYEKELLAIVFAVQKWEQYLTGNHFIIKTDQKSLKWLLQQKISTPFQQFWLSKLLGFDYEIQYKQGKENIAADALSRVNGAEILCLAISTVSSDIEILINQSYGFDSHLKQVLETLQQNNGECEGYCLVGQLIKKKNKIIVGPDSQLRLQILRWYHTSPGGGHSGRDATIKRIKTIFNWRGLSEDVKNFVRTCNICQTAKYDTTAYPGLLQPLPIPEEVWVDISMDFITGLPRSNGKDVILVVVDRLSKYGHFLALSHPFTAVQVAQIYLDNVFKLHGWPKSIVSDRDAVFLSDFWKGLFAVHGTEFLMSTAYHPATDGQTEVVNRCLETYLRCMCGDHVKEWSSCCH